MMEIKKQLKDPRLPGQQCELLQGRRDLECFRERQALPGLELPQQLRVYLARHRLWSQEGAQEPHGARPWPGPGSSL